MYTKTEADILELLAEPIGDSLSEWSNLQNAYDNCFYVSDRTRMMVYARIETYRLFWNHVHDSKHWKHCPREEVGTTIYADIVDILAKEQEEQERLCPAQDAGSRWSRAS